MVGTAPDAQHRSQNDHKDGAHHRQEDPYIIIWPGWGLLQLNPHMGLAVLVHKLHQLLSIIAPDQHHWPSQSQGLLQLLSSSSILSNVKEDSTGSALTRHPGLAGQ